MSDHFQWDDARIFLAIARTGTLSTAASTLRMGVATVSRRLERLEGALNVTLFSRHQNGYRLTDDGSALLERAEALEHAAQTFSASAESQETVSGLVRLATAENLATRLIIPSLGALLQQYPALRMEIVTGFQTVNLHRRDADMAVRMVRPEGGNVTLRRLGTLGFGLYGSSAYLARRTIATDTARYENDSFIGWPETQNTFPAAQWIDRMLRGRPCTLMASTLVGHVAACCAGIGLAVLPHLIARQEGLICLERDLGVDQAIWLTIHSDLAHTRRIRVVADHLSALFTENSDTLSGKTDNASTV